MSKMRIVLSRKGFDSGYGKCPSPILPGGTLLSMPIPLDGGISFRELSYGGKTYYSIWEDLNPTEAHKPDKYAHLDPDIRLGVRKEVVTNWKPIFGQSGSAQRHLENQQIGKGDVFLFFGLFQPVEYLADGLRYKRNSSRKHIIYGYLQVGAAVTGDECKDYWWHPHATSTEPHNTMYIASEELEINGEKTGYPGYGVFNYSDDLVLTKDGYQTSQWELPDFFREVGMTYHRPESFKDDYFQSVKRGQEFVISEDERVTNWFRDMLKYLE